MKLPRLVASAAASMSLLLAGCVNAQVPASAAELPPPGAVPGPALWRVADGDTTVYLFGTVHALPKDKPWYDARVARAFDSADELVTEIDLGNVTTSAQSLASAGVLAEGQTLRGLMSDDNRREFEAALVTLGLPVAALDRYEPWFAAMTLSLLPLLRGGYDTQSGVELALQGRSGERKRAGLETIEQQVALFDTLPVEAQLAFLDQTVEQIPNARNSLDAMVAEWLVGDAAGLAELLNAEMKDPVLYDRLLTARNANWAAWIGERMAQPGTVFVAVGAGHLAGRGSVQEQLVGRGLKVERIWQ